MLLLLRLLLLFCCCGACDDGRLFGCLDTRLTPPGPGTGPLSDRLIPLPRGWLGGVGGRSSGSATNGADGSSKPAVCGEYWYAFCVSPGYCADTVPWRRTPPERETRASKLLGLWYRSSSIDSWGLTRRCCDPMSEV